MKLQISISELEETQWQTDLLNVWTGECVIAVAMLCRCVLKSSEEISDNVDGKSLMDG